MRRGKRKAGEAWLDGGAHLRRCGGAGKVLATMRRQQQRTLEAGPEPASVIADEHKAEEAGWRCGWKQAVNTKQRRPGRQRYEGWRGRGGELEEGRSGNLASMALTGGVHPWHCSCVSARERCMREKEIERGRRRRQRGGAEVLEAGDGDAPASGIEVMELVLLDDGRLERKGAVLLVRCCSSSTELDGSDAETEVSGAGG